MSLEQRNINLLKFGGRVMKYELRIANYELYVTNYELINKIKLNLNGKFC